MPKILVADDNTNIQKMVTLAFQDRGVEVITVGNGEAAVRRLPDLMPDIVLADVFMPVRNGYEVCEFVKKDERFSHIPVILLVGAFDPLDEKEARRVGADGVLKKPFVPPDPLIAMVMSALEKNPKVVAEMAKAREMSAAPPPMPELEIPAKAEPKPLPDYPEPTAEEAAAIYGFGKGVRALDDEPESKASHSPGIKAKKEEDEEFDGSATASDWRRSAADFEVPDELGGSLAFAPDEDFSPTFPSERDVPPRHIRVQDSMQDIEPVFAEKGNSEPVHSPVAAVSAQVNQAIAAAASQSHKTQVEIAPEPETEQRSEYLPSQSAPEIETVETPSVESSTPEAETKETKPESGFLSKAAHWMDMMAPAPSEESNGGGWMANLLGIHKEPAAAQESAMPSVKAPIEAKSEPVVEAMEIAAEPVQTAYSEPHSSDESENISAPRVAERSEPSAASSSDSWFALPPPLLQSAPEPSIARETASQRVVSAPSIPASQSDEFDREPDDVEPSLRDPLLVESPAVHVEPEPLLVNEDVSGPSEYGKRPERMSPLHSFFSPASGDPAVEDAPAAEVSSRQEFPAFETAPVVAAVDEFEERIPTVPPPNREALSAIPFLTPPVPTPQEVRSEETSAHQSSGASAAENMEEMVRKVLEKLQPQLQELLSQGVLKPLVENMLQSELSKKEK